MAPTKRALAVKSSLWLGLTNSWWNTGKKEISFLWNSFPYHVFACLINKFEQPSLLWSVAKTQFPLHVLNSLSIKPHFPVTFNRWSQRFRCLSEPAIFPAEQKRQGISVSKSHNCNCQSSVLATTCSHHFTLPITLGGCGAPNNYLLLAVLHCSVECESSFEAEAKTLNTH